ncbi:MAG: hypothetical protein AB7S92_25725 [Parvibaculaceae bacterium]
MATQHESWSLLDQVSAIHRPDCASLRDEASPGDVAAGMLAADDAVVAYALEARRIYDALKRVIGLTAGLLVIAEASGRREVADLPSLAIAGEAWRETEERLAAAAAPARLAAHLDRLRETSRLTGIGLKALSDLAARSAPVNLAAALAALSAAYRHLQSASDSRFGLMMVDFRHACCNCGAGRH